MDEQLKQISFYLGNALLSGIGLAFAIGAPIKIRLKNAREWWIILWIGLLAFYLFSISSSLANHDYNSLIFLRAISNGVSTSAAFMLFLYLPEKKYFLEDKKTAYAILIFIFISCSFSTYFANVLYSLSNIISAIIIQFSAWIFFVLLAWGYRKKHMPTTILLLTYANAQLPAFLIGKEGFGNDFLLLIAGKLALISAMYYTLGVRDEK